MGSDLHLHPLFEHQALLREEIKTTKSGGSLQQKEHLCVFWVKLVEGNTSHRQQDTALHARSDYAVAFTAWCVLSVYSSNGHSFGIFLSSA